MGNEFSEPAWPLEARLEEAAAAREGQRRLDRALFRALDTQTKVPHLLVELRSLGFVEVCGKDTGGIYGRLEEWLGARWGCKPVTHEAREAVNTGCHRCCYFYPECSDFCCAIPCSDYLMCGCHPCACDCSCSSRGSLALMERQPLRDCDRLCDANYEVETPPTGCFCRTLGLLECDRHFPLCCWYSTRFCCAPCVPKPAVFRRRGFKGENNLGKLTMQLVNFMTNDCGWSLVLCNGTNLGYYGDIREQQIKFAAPHPLNILAPHLMIELRTVGYVEVNGPDTDGVWDKLGAWLLQTWGAKRMRADPNFCDVKFRCSAFKRRGLEGENNIGRCTMQLVDFMTKESAWTLIACNGGNFGRRGDLREQQLVFRKDAHVQYCEDHIMVELRDTCRSSDAGYVEVNGLGSSPGIEQPLDQFLRAKWGCADYRPDAWRCGKPQEPYCDRKYRTPEGFFYRSPKLANNLGKRTVELAQFMASQGWLLLLCNGGAITEMHSVANRMRARSFSFPVGAEFTGQIKREQQMKFTKARPGESAAAPLLLVELRAVPRDPELENVPWCIGPRCRFFEGMHEGDMKNHAWAMQTADRRLTRREEVYHWLMSDAAAEQVHRSKGPMDPDSCSFREYHGPGWRAARREAACALVEGFVEVSGPNTNGVYEQLEGFITAHMRGRRIRVGGPEGSAQRFCDAIFQCGVFRMKRVPFPATNPEIDGYYLGENNFGIYTMRLCDFLVDHLGEWDLIGCSGNALERAWKVDRDRMVSVAAREQQLVFRHRQRRRNVFMAAVQDAPPLGRPPLEPPDYWAERSRQGTAAHEVVPASAEELEWLQELLDRTYRDTRTRDRRSRMAKRFVVATALRSEHPALWERFAQRRRDVRALRRPAGGLLEPRTAAAAPGLARRCQQEEDEGGPSGEAYLMHGTSPTSAMAILRTSFKVDLAGKSVGTLFGPGIYLAEASSKADEYAQDDTEGPHKGLFAVLVCRAVVGMPFVTPQPGNHAGKVTSGEFDCVVGDREKAVGTYREFVFFHEGSVYPEYVAFYRRDHTGTMQPGPGATVYGARAAGSPGPPVVTAPAQQRMGGLP